jgi:hypothetical protein
LGNYTFKHPLLLVVDTKEYIGYGEKEIRKKED